MSRKGYVSIFDFDKILAEAAQCGLIDNCRQIKPEDEQRLSYAFGCYAYIYENRIADSPQRLLVSYWDADKKLSHSLPIFKYKDYKRETEGSTLKETRIAKPNTEAIRLLIMENLPEEEEHWDAWLELVKWSLENALIDIWDLWT